MVSVVDMTQTICSVSVPATRTNYFDRDTCLPMKQLTATSRLKRRTIYKYKTKSRLNDRKMNF